MMFLGFQVPAILPAATDTKPKLPTFKPKWWFKPDRLDARPVIWNIYNHPGDWSWDSYSGGDVRRAAIVHKPSQHRFYVDAGYGAYAQEDKTACSCQKRTNGRFQRGQQLRFHRAFQWWRTHQDGTRHIPEQYVSHFVY